jgi:hypothetical protein
MSPDTPMRERTMLAHLLVLWSFAVVQPTLSVLSHSVGYFFPSRRIDGAFFVVVLLAVVLVPPVVLWVAGALAGMRRPRLRRIVHLVSAGILAAALWAYVAKELAGPGLAVTALVTALSGVAFAIAYDRWSALRSVLTVLLPAPAIFLCAFLFFSDASHLVFPGSTSVAAATSSKPTPVVLLILDELPVATLMRSDGNIDRRRFPNIARFADDATWYRNTLTATWTTTTAVPAILTGQKPDPHDLPVESDHPENIFTLLRRTYAERVLESFTRLCPLSVCPNEASAVRRAIAVVSALSLVYVDVVLPKHSTVRVPNPGNTWGAVLAALNPHRHINPFKFETADLRLFPGPQFDRFLSLIHAPAAGETRPTLYFLHSSLPHNPYNHMPSGRLYRDHDKEEPGLNTTTEDWANDLDAVLHGWQRHLLQTEYADRLVGEMLARLRTTGLYDRAVVAIVSDHGASFRPNGNRRKPRGPNNADVSMVPLFVKAPHQRHGKIVDTPVSTMDLLPTIADLTGARIPWHVDGRPLRLAAEDPGRRFKILDAEDHFLPLNPDRLRRQRSILVRLKEFIFGTGAPPDLFGLGPGRPLVGRALASVNTGPAIDASVKLTDAGEYGHVDLTGPFVPALVRGTIGASEREVPAVAIAVNGRIAGSGGVRRQGDGLGFSVMVEESAFHQGRNDVRVLAVYGRAPRVTVRALRNGS